MAPATTVTCSIPLAPAAPGHRPDVLPLGQGDRPVCSREAGRAVRQTLEEVPGVVLSFISCCRCQSLREFPGSLKSSAVGLLPGPRGSTQRARKVPQSKRTTSCASRALTCSGMQGSRGAQIIFPPATQSSRTRNRRLAQLGCLLRNPGTRWSQQKSHPAHWALSKRPGPEARLRKEFASHDSPGGLPPGLRVKTFPDGAPHAARAPTDSVRTGSALPCAPCCRPASSSRPRHPPDAFRNAFFKKLFNRHEKTS